MILIMDTTKRSTLAWWPLRISLLRRTVMVIAPNASFPIQTLKHYQLRLARIKRSGEIPSNKHGCAFVVSFSIYELWWNQWKVALLLKVQQPSVKKSSARRRPSSRRWLLVRPHWRASSSRSQRSRRISILTQPLFSSSKLTSKTSRNLSTSSLSITELMPSTSSRTWRPSPT